MPHDERSYMLIRGMPDQDGGAVEQWLDGPSSSRLTRDLSGRSTGSAQEPGVLSGESHLCPSFSWLPPASSPLPLWHFF